MPLSDLSWHQDVLKDDSFNCHIVSSLYTALVDVRIHPAVLWACTALFHKPLWRQVAPNPHHAPTVLVDGTAQLRSSTLRIQCVGSIGPCVLMVVLHHP